MTKQIKINTSPIVLLYALEGVLWNLHRENHLECAEYWIQFLQQLRMEMQEACVVTLPSNDKPKKKRMSPARRKHISRAMRAYHKKRMAAASVTGLPEKKTKKAK